MSAPANRESALQKVQNPSNDDRRDRMWVGSGLEFDYLEINGLGLDLMQGYSDHP